MLTTMAKWAAMITASHLVANWCPRLSLMCTMSNPPWWRSRCVTRPTRPKLWPPVIMHTLPVINDKLYHSTHYAAYYNSDSNVYIPVHYSKTRSVSEYGLTSHSTHYRSFQRRVFPVNHLHLTDNLTRTTKRQNTQNIKITQSKKSP